MSCTTSTILIIIIIKPGFALYIFRFCLLLVLFVDIVALSTLQNVIDSGGYRGGQGACPLRSPCPVGGRVAQGERTSASWSVRMNVANA